jgi:hypothetical protein
LEWNAGMNTISTLEYTAEVKFFMATESEGLVCGLGAGLGAGLGGWKGHLQFIVLYVYMVLEVAQTKKKKKPVNLYPWNLRDSANSSETIAVELEP